LSFILIKIEVHDVPFSVGVAKGEERDRLLQQGDNFHTSIVHCPDLRLLPKFQTSKILEVYNCAGHIDQKVQVGSQNFKIPEF
jgi:hypothetical protein